LGHGVIDTTIGEHSWAVSFEGSLMRHIFVAIIFSAIGLAAQDAPSKAWTKVEKQDPLRGTQFVQYSLDGKYLTPPRKASPAIPPAIVLRCVPGSYAHGRARGKLLAGYIFVGGVVDTNVGNASTGTTVEFRLDDGKLQTYSWSHSTDFSSLFFGDMDLDILLYGHFLPHKENTNPQVRKVVLGVPEFLGGEVVMQFDMPDSSEVGDSCGVIWHKR
jgi:hypothetical protein